MAIASQRPTVGGLGGGSNLAEEVVVFCILAEQKSCLIQRWTGGPSHTLNLIPTYVLKRENLLVMTREFGRCFFCFQDAVKQKGLQFVFLLFTRGFYLVCGFAMLTFFVFFCQLLNGSDECHFLSSSGVVELFFS